VDTQLVTQAQAGEAEAFDQLVALHTDKLFRVVYRWMVARDETENIVQETWLRAWKALSTCDPEQPFFPWLAKIAVNLTRDAWRKKKPVDFADLGKIPERFHDHTPGPEGTLERKEQLERLQFGVRTLRMDYRIALGLRYELELSYAEIAEMMEIPLNTVRTHLFRAKAQLRRWMERDYG
jgi:RNA polymerase sigma-70 factor (ECF subfamily)